MYLTYKPTNTGFGGIFHDFLGQDINLTVWTRNGPKSKKQVMVFQGLKEHVVERESAQESEGVEETKDHVIYTESTERDWIWK